MVFPIGDDNRAVKGMGPAYVTIFMVVANILVFVFLQDFGTNDEFVYGYSVVPAQIVQGVDYTTPQTMMVQGEPVRIPQAPGPGGGAGAPLIYLTLLTSMFMHAGFGHLGGNLLFLWIFGDNVEHRFGHGTFLLFYLVSGTAATAAQIAVDPGSVVPLLGASGAISGVLGAYLVLFPRNRVHTFFFYTIISIPALAAIGLWVLLQFFGGFGAITGEQIGGVAYAAHLGGFFAGAILALILRLTIRREPHNAFSEVVERDPRSRRMW
ncbi:hypothetical protein BH23ACT11_BH23ACT11_17610 [soil metagenome]